MQLTYPGGLGPEIPMGELFGNGHRTLYAVVPLYQTEALRSW